MTRTLVIVVDDLMILIVKAAQKIGWQSCGWQVDG